MAFQPRSRRRTGVQLALALLIILVLGVLSLYMDTSGIQKRTAALHEVRVPAFRALGRPLVKPQTCPCARLMPAALPPSLRAAALSHRLPPPAGGRARHCA